MNHPYDEQWMSYLYDELEAHERAALGAHLEKCASCKAKVAQWQSAQKNLDAWRLPPMRRRPTMFAPVMIKWAAAAVIFLCIGFSVGRLTGGTSAEKVRAQIEPQLRQEIIGMVRTEIDKASAKTLVACDNQTRGLLKEYSAAADKRRADDNALVFAAINKLGAQHVADYLSLKKDVDTVALNADAALRTEQRELTELSFVSPRDVKPLSH